MILTRCLPALLLFCLFSFTPIKKYVRKAESRMEYGDIKAAKIYFEKALSIDSLYFPANLGMGLLYSEFLENYEQALPYLETAYNSGANDSLPELIFALAKCYHQKGDFDKALELYEQLALNREAKQDKEFSRELKKRTEDCRYAQERAKEKPNTLVYLVNAGQNINSKAPEYVPVISPREGLIFTSKRKDNKKEKLNRYDGKYYEAMYQAGFSGNGFSKAKSFHLADQYLSRRPKKNHEAVVSMSQDGKTLFTFRRGSIYKVDLQNKRKQPEPLLITGHKKAYQNHAFLTRDGQTLYFTSDVKGGLGGNDIYRCTRKQDGTWAAPQNLGAPVNTQEDEDAPFLSEDGKYLYFASKGHPGFGNYDIYRSFVQGETYAPPENLGKPFNSPGHDIFFVSDSAQATAYFASGRNGGHGDMDIYKVIYLDKFDPTCPETSDPALSLARDPKNTAVYAQPFTLQMPEGYTPVSSQWFVNGENRGPEVSELNAPNGTGNFTLAYRVLAHCDTCLVPVVACNTLVISPAELKQPKDSAINKPKDGVEDPGDITAGTILNPEILKKLGFDDAPVYFDFDRNSLKSKERERLGKNVAILKKNIALQINLTGHADSRGADAYNVRLSKKRALAVKKYLVEQGIAETRFKEITGKGSAELLNNCGKGTKCSEKQHSVNRRVTITLVGGVE